jgi:rhodanese-related sulfurtransferase
MAALMVLGSGCGKPHPAKRAPADNRASQGAVRPVEVSAGEVKPGRESSRYDITLAQLREYHKSHAAVIIDARDPSQFASSHVRGAINLPAIDREAYISRVLQEVPSGQLVIIYCSSAFCEASNSIYEYLRAQGYTNLRVYKPGWAVLSIANVERTKG